MEVQGSYGRILQGVSQQPAEVRLAGQVTRMVNALPDVVAGTKNRIGTTHAFRLLMNNLHPDTYIYHYRRGEDEEEYFVIFQPNSDPIIYAADGTLCVLSMGAGSTDYVRTSKPRENLQLMTVGDFTFTLNRTVPVKLRADKSPVLDNQVILFVAFANYGATYKVIIDGAIAASHTTPNGTAGDEPTIKTDYVAEQIRLKLETWDATNQYVFTIKANCIFISRVNGASFTISTVDGAKGEDLVAIKHRVSTTALLPNNAPDGYLIQIWTTGSKPESRYWLKADNSQGSTVVWQETIAPDMRLGFDKTTLPFTLIRTSIIAGIPQFEYVQGEWEDRKVGDDLTNPFPSIINEDNPQPVSSIMMVQNRLIMTSQEAVVASRTSRFFDYFRYTTLASIDTDPFDCFADINEVYNILYGVTLDGDVVLFTEDQQFILPCDKVLTNATAVIRPATQFQITRAVRPVPAGESVMFAFDSDAYSGLREFFTDSFTDTKKAQPITSHVNRYIKGTILELEASPNISRAFALSTQERNKLFVYDWLWQGTDKVQSAWHEWVWDEGTIIHAVRYSKEKVYIVLERGESGVYMEVFDSGDPVIYPQVGEPIRTDRMSEVTMNWDGNRWSAVLPWVPQTVNNLECVITSGWSSYIGGTFGFEYDQGSNSIFTEFDLAPTHNTARVVVGELYQMELEPTPPLVRDSQDRVSSLYVPMVGRVYLNLDKYPDFTVDVLDTKTGFSRSVPVSNKVGGQINNVVGHVRPTEGTAQIAIRRRSTDATYTIKVRSALPFQLRDIEWDGSYNPRKRRV